MEIHNTYIVLHIDSDKEYREKIGRVLESFPDMSLQVLWASTLNEGMKSLEKLRPNVIISELDLPDSKNVRTLNTYFNRTKDIPLIILSDVDLSISEEDSAVKNVEKFLPKSKATELSISEEVCSLLNNEDSDNNNEFEGLKVLIIDDDSTTRYIQGDYLRQEGCLVEEAEDGFMALALMRKYAISNSQFDVVIVDLMMPNMDGFEFLSTIRKRPWGKEIPLLVSSSRNDSDAIIKCKSFNIKGYIIKPTTRDSLLSKVKSAIAKTKKKA